METKAQEALRIAKEVAREAKTATDFHNVLFGISGKFGAEREAFFQTPEYEEIFRIRDALPEFEPTVS